jgi:hypothetical protein
MSSGRWPEVSEPLPGFRLVLCIRKIRAIRSPVVKKCLVLASSAALAGNHAHLTNSFGLSPSSPVAKQQKCIWRKSRMKLNQEEREIEEQ